MIATAASWVGIADVVVGTVLTLIMALVGFVFRDLRAEVKENSRHVQAVMFSLWRLLWRVDAMEDFLEKHHGYNPPRTVPEWPFRDDTAP